MFGRFRGAARKDGDIASRLYGAIVAQAREPALYASVGVPDTIDGRFDMVILHAVLLIARLDREGERGKAVAQAVFDTFSRDMDRTLREMGVGDLTVPRRVRAMAEGFYGRLAAYAPGLGNRDRAALAAAIDRNVFPDPSNPPAADALAGYALASAETLAAVPLDEILGGRVAFAAPRLHAPERLPA